VLIIYLQLNFILLLINNHKYILTSQVKLADIWYFVPMNFKSRNANIQSDRLLLPNNRVTDTVWHFSMENHNKCFTILAKLLLRKFNVKSNEL